MISPSQICCVIEPVDMEELKLTDAMDRHFKLLFSVAETIVFQN